MKVEMFRKSNTELGTRVKYLVNRGFIVTVICLDRKIGEQNEVNIEYLCSFLAPKATWDKFSKLKDPVQYELDSTVLGDKSVEQFIQLWREEQEIMKYFIENFDDLSTGEGYELIDWQPPSHFQ